MLEKFSFYAHCHCGFLSNNCLSTISVQTAGQNYSTTLTLQQDYNTVQAPFQKKWVRHNTMQTRTVNNSKIKTTGTVTATTFNKTMITAYCISTLLMPLRSLEVNCPAVSQSQTSIKRTLAQLLRRKLGWVTSTFLATLTQSGSRVLYCFRHWRWSTVRSTSSALAKYLGNSIFREDNSCDDKNGKADNLGLAQFNNFHHTWLARVHCSREIFLYTSTTIRW